MFDSQDPWLTPRGLGRIPGVLIIFAPRGLGQLSGALVSVQGPWAAPRGLDWLPGALVSWLTGASVGSQML